VATGLRSDEMIELINKFQNVGAVNGFYRYESGMFRGEKQICLGHLTETALNLIKTAREKLNDIVTLNYYRKFGYVEKLRGMCRCTKR